MIAVCPIRRIFAQGDIRHFLHGEILDLGGDKMLPMAHREHNPFLGWRGIQVLLDRPEILHTHLRAILRASAFGPMRILVPMVTTVAEIQEVKSILADQMAVLDARGQAYDPDTFVDPEGFLAEVERLERLYLDQIAEEQR